MEDPATQTGGLMAWAWGASKVLDAVYAGLDIEFGLDAEASMVTGVSRWGKATAVCGAFEKRFRLTIPTCSGAGGLAQYNYRSAEGGPGGIPGIFRKGDHALYIRILAYAACADGAAEMRMIKSARGFANGCM